MTKRDKNRKRDMNARMRRQWEVWEARARALTRHGSARDVKRIAADMLREKMADGGAMVLSIDDLTAEHRKVHRLTMRQAVDEVESFARDAVGRLQKTWRLVHPLTEYGLTHAEEVDPNDRDGIRKCVPGTGDPHAGATRGWRVAHGEDDPCYIAYVNHGLAVVNGGLKRTQEQVTAAVGVGILPSPVALPSLPSSVVDGDA